MPKMPRAKGSLRVWHKINLNYSPKNSADLTLGPMIIFPFLCQKPSGSGRFLLPFALSLFLYFSRSTPSDRGESSR